MSELSQGEMAFHGRALHFIAIGGAGMSGLASACHALGARVSGSDRAESTYVERLRAAGIEPLIGHDPDAVPVDADVVVSTAIAPDNAELVIARQRGQRVIHRGELLAELTAMKRLIGVSGAHGKTTTAGMLAHMLLASGADPAFLLGGELPGGGPDGHAANARWSDRAWVVAEADESDGSFLELRPEIAVVTNVELDHHSHWGGRELIAAFTRFSARAAALIRPADRRLAALDGAGSILSFAVGTSPGGPAAALAATDVRPVEGGSEFTVTSAATGGLRARLGVPGRHNVANALAAIGALLEARELDPDLPSIERLVESLATFPGMARRLERKGTSTGGALIYDDYAHHPTEVAASLAALRELPHERLIALFQPHLYSRTKALASRFGRALGSADEINVLDVYPARELPVGPLEGVSGLAVAEAAADAAPGRRVRWLVDVERAADALRSELRSGDILVTLGAGDVHRVADALVEGKLVSPEVPTGIERDYPLARLTTVRAGGAARMFAKVGSEARLVDLLGHAREIGAEVGVVGSGSNLLVADDGFEGLVLKMEGNLAELERDGESRVLCGAGVRLPSAAAKTAGWGLTGLEFGVNIPGTVGGAVRMNANAYGGELARTLEWVDVCTADGTDRRTPDQLGFSYRRSNLGVAEVVARACFHLGPAEPEDVKAVLAEMRSKRRDAQPSGIKTFGSTFKNPDDRRAEGRSAGQLLEAAGCRGLQVGGARFSPKHANFVENTGDASTVDILELMAEGRRRVHAEFGVVLEPEVQVLGLVEWPASWDLEGTG